jgi:hypothetical protein
MLVLAAGNPTGSVMTFAFPVILFAGIVLWAFFQYSRR